MKHDKAFDCVAMKDAIQTRHAQEYANISDVERWRRIEERLNASDDIVARKWRSLASAHDKAVL